MDTTTNSSADEKLHLDLLNQSVDLIWRATLQGEFTFFSPCLKAMTGFEPEELLHKPISEYAPLFMTEESAARAIQSLKDRQMGTFEDRPLIFDLVFRRKDGSEYIGEQRTSPIIDGNGEIIGVQGTTRDVSEQRKMVQELEKSRELFLLFFKLSNDPCCITERENGLIVDVNPVWQATFGWTRDDVLGKSPIDLELLSPSNQKSLSESLGDVAENGSTIEYKLSLRTKAGEQRSCLLDCRTVVVSGVECVFTLIEDITDKENFQKEKQQLEKLESLSEFAGGIAHQVNNALTGVIGNISMAKLTDDKAERELFLHKSEQASLQVKAIAQQLLTFSDGGNPAVELTDLEDFLRNSITSLANDSNIKFEFLIEKDLRQVKIDQDQIKQVIHNLILNGQQSMSNKGSISISAKNIKLAAGSKAALKPGNYVQIAIEDQGAGIAPANQAKIFNPFFTTKSTGKGLGLAVSHSVIQKHHGHISVVSQLNKGSTVSFLLPAQSENSAITQASQTAQLRLGKGKILVMDDSEPIQILMKKMLDRLGYEAVITSDGGEAIKAYELALKQNQSFLAVILDLTVPGGIGGQETLQSLLQQDPQVKAIVASGYSDSDVLAQYQNYGFLGSIPKPFRIVELGATLDKVIQSSKATLQ